MSEDTEPVKQEPPGFPYPDEEIVHSSVRNAPNHEPGEDSWFCLSKPEETKVHTFGDHTHENPYRLTFHTPLRGSVSFFVNRHDADHLIQCMLALKGDDGGTNECQIDLEYYDRLISDDFDIVDRTDR